MLYSRTALLQQVLCRSSNHQCRPVRFLCPHYQVYDLLRAATWVADWGQDYQDTSAFSDWVSHNMGKHDIEGCCRGRLNRRLTRLQHNQTVPVL